jgi:hypothetical protein
MRNVRRYVHLILVTVGVWPCLLNALPAAADEIPFFLDNQINQNVRMICSGPWGRTSGDVRVSHDTGFTQFYAAEINIFSPFGNWRCGADLGSNNVDFCLAEGAPHVKFTLTVRDQPPFTPLELVDTQTCAPTALPPPALVQLSGSATKVGEGRAGRSTLKLKGKFNVSPPLALDLATVTIDGLLHEVEGAGELVSGLPLVLTPRSGSEADEATYTNAPNTPPTVRLDVRQRTGRPAEFSLKLENASIPQFPQHCALEEEPTTALALRFTIDDGVNLPFVVEGLAEWECLGDDPQTPETLKVLELLPIAPTPSVPAP